MPVFAAAGSGTHLCLISTDELILNGLVKGGFYTTVMEKQYTLDNDPLTHWSTLFGLSCVTI